MWNVDDTVIKYVDTEPYRCCHLWVMSNLAFNTVYTWTLPIWFMCLISYHHCESYVVVSQAFAQSVHCSSHWHVLLWIDEIVCFPNCFLLLLVFIGEGYCCSAMRFVTENLLYKSISSLFVAVWLSKMCCLISDSDPHCFTAQNLPKSWRQRHQHYGIVQT